MDAEYIERATNARVEMVDALCYLGGRQAIGQVSDLLDEIAHTCEDHDEGLKDAVDAARQALLASASRVALEGG